MSALNISLFLVKPWVFLCFFYNVASAQVTSPSPEPLVTQEDALTQKNNSADDKSSPPETLAKDPDPFEKKPNQILHL